jgi:hypothetical protein
MVTNELKDFALGEDSGLVVEGAIAKVKGQTGGDAAAVAHLNEITGGESGSVQGLENKEAMKCSLGSAHRDGISDQRPGSGDADSKEQKGCARAREVWRFHHARSRQIQVGRTVVGEREDVSSNVK